MSIVVLGLSHHTAPVQVRERFAFAEGKMPEILHSMQQKGLVNEAVILSTCNRVEIYAATSHEPSRAHAELREFLVKCHQYTDPLSDELYFLKEPASVEHLFKVASGMDSMVLGETEIFGQLKRAYELAFQHKCTGALLNKAFQSAFNVAKQIRTETNIQRGSISVASVAVELAQKIFTSLEERQVLVIGAGETGEKTAKALLSRGAQSITVTNRSYERAEALARELNGRAVPFESWSAEFAKIDIIISSTAAPHYILDQNMLEPLMPRRKNRPLLLIDIAVPRDIAPEVNLLDDVYLYNIDDLQAIADGYLKQRQKEVVECESIIRAKVQALLGNRRPPPGLSAPERPAFQ